MSAIQPLDTFQVQLKLPDFFSKHFFALIPKQRAVVNSLIEKRVILSYALDMDRSRLWITMQAKNQNEIMDILATFPIIKDVKVEIFELAFYDTTPVGLPELIMN